MIVNSVNEKQTLTWRGGGPITSTRVIAEERAVALTYCGSTYAVMMATPNDLEDFGIGFSVTEGVVQQLEEIGSLERIESEIGIEVRMWLEPSRARNLALRRRSIAGPVGCGLCGIESLEQACAFPRKVDSFSKFCARDLLDAVNVLPSMQHLNQRTRAVHAAAFWDPTTGIASVREDVGRHNALDKLAGSLFRAGVSRSNGAILLTSRVSVEMVQKTAMIGVPVLVAVSAPTTLAIETANHAGITLVAVARGDGYEVFTHHDRISFPTAKQPA